MATAKKSPPASTTRAVALWDEELAAAAKKQAAVEKPIGLFKRLNISGGVLMIDDKKVPGNEIEVIVLCATHENQWYNKPYNPAVPAVPACYAFGDPTLEEPEGQMAPDDSVEDKQGDDNGLCANCWANKMGSAETGKGKACQNVRRMIVTTPDALESAEALKNAETRMFKVPVMSVRNWVKYVHELEESIHRPSYGAVTKISVVPDQKSQWQVLFEFVELVNFDAELYGAMKKRVSDETKNLLSPYPKLEEQEEQAPRRGTSKVAMPQNGKAAPAGVGKRPVVPPPKAQQNGAAAKRAGGKY